jgi:hypothetical protein
MPVVRNVEIKMDKIQNQLAEIVELLPNRCGGSYSKIEDIIGALHLGVKYLLFDIEATRRENAYLRNIIRNDKPGGGMHQPV